MCCIYLKWSIEPLLHVQSVWLVLFFVTHVCCLQPQNLVHPSSLSLQNVYTCTIMHSTVHMQAKKFFQYKIIKYSKRLKYLYEFHLSLLAMYMYKENEPKKNKVIYHYPIEFEFFPGLLLHFFWETFEEFWWLKWWKTLAILDIHKISHSLKVFWWILNYLEKKYFLSN